MALFGLNQAKPTKFNEPSEFSEFSEPDKYDFRLEFALAFNLCLGLALSRGQTRIKFNKLTKLSTLADFVKFGWPCLALAKQSQPNLANFVSFSKFNMFINLRSGVVAVWSCELRFGFVLSQGLARIKFINFSRVTKSTNLTKLGWLC